MIKTIQKLGLILFLIGLSIFTATIFTGSFSLTQSELDSFISAKGFKSEIIQKELQNAVVSSENQNIFQFSSGVVNAVETSNANYENLIERYDAEKNWDKKGAQYQYMIFDKPHS